MRVLFSWLITAKTGIWWRWEEWQGFTVDDIGKWMPFQHWHNFRISKEKLLVPFIPLSGHDKDQLRKPTAKKSLFRKSLFSFERLTSWVGGLPETFSFNCFAAAVVHVSLVSRSAHRTLKWIIPYLVQLSFWTKHQFRYFMAVLIFHMKDGNHSEISCMKYQKYSHISYSDISWDTGWSQAAAGTFLLVPLGKVLQWDIAIGLHSENQLLERDHQWVVRCTVERSLVTSRLSGVHCLEGIEYVQCWAGHI